jgi:hypothetical protein
MPDEILTPEDVRALIERSERHHAEMRATLPPSLARFFPPITDEQFRYVMERALLGEVRRPFELHVVLSAAKPPWQRDRRPS